MLTPPDAPTAKRRICDVEIIYVADTIPQQFHRYADVWFKERQNPQRLVLHGFVK